MKCDFCGFEFDESACVGGCGGCPMAKSCQKIKCPNCNYEMLPMPEHKLWNKVKDWSRRLWNMQRIQK